jgi:hypothetical protein
MTIDGFVLSALKQELEKNGLFNILPARVNKIYQRSQYEILILLHRPGENLTLLISSDPRFARVHLTDSCHEECPVAQGIRVAMSEDRRIFTPIDRASYKWKREYNKRPAVERVNSRLDVSFGFEVHTIRGQRKMKLRCSLALCVMLAMALGRIKENQEEKLRSLVACG